MAEALSATTLLGCMDEIIKGTQNESDERARATDLNRSMQGTLSEYALNNPLPPDVIEKIAIAVRDFILEAIDNYCVRGKIMDILKHVFYPKLSESPADTPINEKIAQVQKWFDEDYASSDFNPHTRWEIGGRITDTTYELHIQKNDDGSFHLSLTPDIISFDPSDQVPQGLHGWTDLQGNTHGDFDEIYEAAFISLG